MVNLGKLKFKTGSKFSKFRESLPRGVQRRIPASKAEAKRLGFHLIPGVYIIQRRKRKQMSERAALNIPVEKTKAESAGERYSRMLREREQK